MQLEGLRAILREPDRLRKESFAVARGLASFAISDNYGAKSQDLVLRALEHRELFGESKPIINGLAREFGLFPYLDPDSLSDGDLLAYEYHRAPTLRSHNIVFHRPQAHIYRSLARRESVVLSAPTSFGKSLLIDAVVAGGMYDNILIIVPTLALIDETRRRLRRLAEGYSLITHPMQRPGSRNVFLLTQERASVLESLEKIDFFVVDEFYKLDPVAPGDHRATILNHVFYKLATQGKPFYLLGPSILGITEYLSARIACKFIHEPYHTVASEIHSVEHHDPFDALAKLCGGLKGPTLIFCQSPKRASDVVRVLIESDLGRKPSERLRRAVEWIGNHYHPDWHFVRALASGMGIHHGRIPRALAHYVVRCFEEDDVGVLVCTSSLIEGVNTKAQNVVIFDNKINKRKYDFFTFNNIRGRAGRMFKHFVGHVYLFHDVPQQKLPFVDIPAFSQSDGASDSLLVQLQETELNADSRKRLEPYKKQRDLSFATIRDNAGIDPGAQIALARTLRGLDEASRELMVWSAFPTKAQLELACRLIWDHFDGPSLARGSVSTPKQLNHLISCLRGRPTTKRLIETHMRYEKDPNKAVPAVLDFLRLWATFHFPRLLRALDLIQREVMPTIGVTPGSYGHFAACVESLFHEPAIVALEEYGLPLEVARKLEGILLPADGLDAVLARLAKLNVESLPLSEFEKELVRDVVAGLSLGPR